MKKRTVATGVHTDGKGRIHASLWQFEPSSADGGGLGTRASLVIFDLDGTLLDSQAYWLAVVQEASRQFGGVEVRQEDFGATFGQSSADDVKQYGLHTTAVELDAFYNASLSRHAHRLMLVDGVMDVVAQVRAMGLRVAVATNSPREFTEKALAAVGLSPEVDATACADEVARPKPAPDLVRLAARKLDTPMERCVMVGDSRYDVEAARGAPCFVVGIGVDADVRVGSLRDVPAVLRRG